MNSYMSRRAALASGALMIGAAGLTTSGHAAITANGLDGESLFADVARYAAYGPKRTASLPDLAVAEWLASEAKAAGADVTLRPFAVRQFMLERALLLVGGRSLETLPFWYPKATHGLIAAPLTMEADKARGNCLVVLLPSGREGLRDMPRQVARAAAAGAAALILVPDTPSGEYFGHMQPDDCLVPTLIVGDRDAQTLQAAAASGATARIEIAGSIRPRAQAFNIVARVLRSGPLFVVTTPTSAWTSAGGERGPGVALWLGLMRRAIAGGRGSWVFGAFSGHELDGAGSRAFLASPDAPDPKKVRAWCHLGASIANRSFDREQRSSLPLDSLMPGGRLLTNEAVWLTELERAFEGAAIKPQLAAANQAIGELKLYFGAGYPTFGFEGGGFYFHAPGDTALSTSPNLLGQVGVGLDGFFRQLGV
jgi:hypothetical protein